MKVVFLFASTALLFGSAAFSAGVQDTPSAKLQLDEMECLSLGSVPSDGIAGSAAFSADGRHIAIAVKQDSKMVVFRDGARSESYEYVGGLTFSPNGQHLAHVGRTGKGTCVIVDGQRGQLFDSAGEITWSPNSTHCAFVATRGGDRYVVVRHPHSEEVGRPYAGIVDGSLTFSLDGRRMAYVAQQGDAQVAVVGAMAGPAYGAILRGRVVFCPGSPRFAYVGLKNPASVRGVLVIDGVEQGGPQVAITETFPFAFSHDGTAWTIVAAHGGKFVVVVQKGGQRTQTGPHDWIADLDFLPTGHGVIYTAQKADRTFVVSNGREGPHHDGRVLSPKVSPDGRRLAYVVECAGRQRVMLDRAEHTEHEAILAESIRFSPDGATLTYVYRRSTDCHLAVCRDNKTQHFGPYKAVGRPAFSPNGTHVAFSFVRGGAPGLAVDGYELTCPIAIVNEPAFDSETSVRFVAISDRQFVSQRFRLSSAREPSRLATLATEPRSSGPRLAAVGKALTARGIEAAIEQAGRVIATDPGNGEALYTRGALYLELGRADLAYEDFGKLLELRPDNAAGLVARGRAAECLRRYGDAVEHYSRALGSSPNGLEALAHRGSLLAALNKPDAAKRDLALSFNVPSVPAEREALVFGLLTCAGWAVDRAATVWRQQADRPDIEWQHARVLTSQAFAHARVVFPESAARIRAVTPSVERILHRIFRATSRNPLADRNIEPFRAFDEMSHRRLAVEIARQRAQKEWRGRFLNLALHVAIWSYSEAQSQDFARLGRLLQSIGENFGDAGIARLGRDISEKSFEPDRGPDVTLSVRKSLVLWPWMQAKQERDREQLHLNLIERWSPVFGEELSWEDWVEQDAEHSRAMLRSDLAEVLVELMELRAAMLLPEYPDVRRILKHTEKRAE